MKTLKQWYDSLSEPTQLWIENNCSAWFDKNQADYYKKPVDVKDKEALHSLLKSKEGFEKYTDNANTRTIANKYVALLRYLTETQPDLMPESLVDECVYQVLNVGINRNGTWLHMSDKNKNQAFKCCYQRYDKMSLANALYLVKDYDNLKFDWEEVEEPYLTSEIVEIIGIDAATELAYDMGTYNLSKMIQMGRENKLFDSLFFCENSKLTQSNKMEILRQAYTNGSHLPDENMMQDFFKRIVAVDHSYLRFIYTIIKSYPALAMKLYQQKKPADELTGNESVAETFRYNKELRKLFVIAHACALKRISKVKSGIVKEVAPLLKIYGYNWDEIYNAMYPEDPSLK